MSVAKPQYATSASLTFTPTSLADGSWHRSAAIDNATTRYMDVLLGGTLKMGTSPDVGGYVDLFIYATWDNSTYTLPSADSDAGWTPDGNESVFKRIEQIVVDATTGQVYNWGPLSVAALYGGNMPQKWGLICHNMTGAALGGATTAVTKFTGITLESV